MKKFFFVLVLLMSVYACKDIRQKLLPSFTVNIPDIKLTIPVVPFTQDKEVPVGALRVSINMDSAIRANTGGAFGSGAVTSVKVEKVVFKLMAADEANNLSNFESGRLRLYSDNDTAAIDIATIAFPSNYTDSLVVVPKSSPDISNYLRGSELSYNIFWKNRKPTTRKLKLSIRVSLAVQ